MTWIDVLIGFVVTSVFLLIIVPTCVLLVGKMWASGTASGRRRFEIDQEQRKGTNDGPA